jgi:hypothetical protein
MFRIIGPRQRTCEGIGRREFLRLGSIASLSLSTPALLQARTAQSQPQPSGFGRARRCLLLFLTGGPPQLDTWDPKPDAPAEIRGEFKPIHTNVPGIQICELFPRLARLADRYCIVRSVTHGDTVHTSAGYTMLTGDYHPPQPMTIRTSVRC